MINFIKRNYKKYWFSLLINIIIMLFYVICFNCCFETNDDFEMKKLAIGFYGAQEEHLVFINVIIGYVLKLLYTIIPAISWYEIIQLLLLLFAFTSITYVLINRFNIKIFPYILLLIFAISHMFYVWMQFTKTSSLLAVAGYIMIAYYLENNNKRDAVLGICLLFLSMLMRINNFLLCSLICVCVFIPILLNNKKVLKKLIIIAIVCGALLGCSLLTDKLSYSSKPWNDYVKYNNETTNFMDFGWPNYYEEKDLYSKYDIDETAFSLYNGWNYGDIDKFTTDLMINLNNERLSKDVTLIYIITFAYRLTLYLLTDKNCAFFTTLVLLSVVLFIVKYKKSKLYSSISIGLMFVFFLILSFYCYYIRMDLLLDRIEISFLVIILFNTLYLTDDFETNISTRKTAIIVSILFIIFCLYRVNDLRIKAPGFTNNDVTKEVIYKDVITDANHLYILETQNDIDYQPQLFYKIQMNEIPNIAYLGGWTINYPQILEYESKYGINNPYKDSVNNDRVYFMVKKQGSIELIVKYINKYYDANANYQFVKDIENFQVYSIVSD